jgi:bla regulator protein blaR1
MATSTLTRPLEQTAPPSELTALPPASPAAKAAARLSRASLLVGLLGLVSALFIATRLIESWRIDPGSHHATIGLLGFRLSYPSANAGAIVVIVLATIGLAVALIAVGASARELLDSRRLTRRLEQAARGTLVDGTRVIDDRQAHAFCAGLLRPRVYITTAALARLDDGALAAVLAHERHHARCRDPLRLATGRVMTRSLFFVPWLRSLHERHRLLTELGADENAARAGGPALARAMLAFEPSGIDPIRVDRLLGIADAPTWRFPAALALAAGFVVAVLAASAELAAQVASGTATLNPPFLSRQPCVVVLATIPTLITLLWRGVARIRR